MRKTQNEKIISISLEEYIRLKKRDAKLDYLECSGVDNWSGYGYALNPEEDEDEVCISYHDFVIQLEEEIRNKFK